MILPGTHGWMKVSFTAEEDKMLICWKGVLFWTSKAWDANGTSSGGIKYAVGYVGLE